MKKITLLFILVLYQVHLFAQLEKVILPESDVFLEDLIPDNWKIISMTNGDLNEDGLNDVAFVIQETDSKKLFPNDGLGMDTLNLNPRILGIYFKDKSGKLIKKSQSDDFILIQEIPTMEDPFDDIEILINGDLKISFHFWYSAGSWMMSDHAYIFRFQNDSFELIQYESSEGHRGTGETTDQSIDFLNQEWRIITTTFDENDKKVEQAKKSEFILKGLKSLESLKKPFEWEFNGLKI